MQQATDKWEADTLTDCVKLPESLRDLPYLQEHYGTVAWSIRGIFEGYAGWFDGNPTRLNPLPALFILNKKTAVTDRAERFCPNSCFLFAKLI